MKKWKKEEDDKIELLFKSGKKYSEICEELNITDGVFRSRLKTLKLNKKTFKLQKKECLNCEKEFEFNNNQKVERLRKFCNNSCSAHYNNLRKIKKDFGNCKNCNNKLNKSIKKYCNNKCQGEFKRSELFKLINDGNNKTTEISAKMHKMYLIEKHGNKCMDCGWCKIHPITNNVPIQLEHIDGNSDNNCLDNLKLLCPNCHSLTITYGSLNKNGRDSIRNIKRKIWRDNNK